MKSLLKGLLSKFQASVFWLGFILGVISLAALAISWTGVLPIETRIFNSARALAELVSGTLTWPVVLFIIISLPLLSERSRSGLVQLLESVEYFQGFGAEVRFTKQGASVLHEKAEKTFASYRENIDRHLELLAKKHDIYGKLLSIASDDLNSFLMERKKKKITEICGFRITIHVPDILFENSLYQLVDYYPDGGGKGRVKSSRFGIIGKAWRSRTYQYKANVDSESADSLVIEWGMTASEAAKFQQKKPCVACIVLKDENLSPVGLVYFDADDPDAFGVDNEGELMKDLRDVLIQASKAKSLTQSLREINAETSPFGPHIEIP